MRGRTAYGQPGFTMQAETEERLKTAQKGLVRAGVEGWGWKLSQGRGIGVQREARGFDH